jgi:hypothetical protein
MNLAASLSNFDEEKSAHETIASELFFPFSTCSANVIRVYDPSPSIIYHFAIIAMPCDCPGGGVGLGQPGLSGRHCRSYSS